MTLNLESISDGKLPEAPARSGKPYWQRPWVGPLAIAMVVFVYLASKPYIGVPENQAPLQPHDNFPLYFPLLITHISGGTVVMVTMVLQVWPWLRQHHPKWHRVSGRIYMLGVLVSGTMGLVIVWWAPMPGKVGALCQLLVVLATTAAAYKAIRRGDVAKHRRYMLYSFAVAANNIWAFFAMQAIIRFELPIDPVYALEATRWIPWVGGLMVVQWWLYRTADDPLPSTQHGGR